jgi:RNA polymerase primary sigma factor
MEHLLQDPHATTRQLEQALTAGSARTVREHDLCWVQAEPIAAMGRAWLEQHPGVTMRQLCLRVARVSRRMGYRSSLSTVQPILAGRTQRTRGFVYRAMLKLLPGAGRRVPESHVLPSSASSAPPTRTQRVGLGGAPAGQRANSPSCCAQVMPDAGTSVAGGWAPPLTPAEEVALARRIEAADQHLQSLLLRSALATQELARIAAKLQTGELQPWDVVVCSRLPRSRQPGRTHQFLQRALAEVGELEAQCTPWREELLQARITAERRRELREQLAARFNRMARALADLRLVRWRVRALCEHYRALLEQAEQAAQGPCAPPATAVPRLERALGLPLDDGRRTWGEVVAAVSAAASARNEMVKANQRLVVIIARKYRYLGLDLPDLVAEGNLGLLSAVERYDYRRGCRFSTYASWWIRSRIERAIPETGRTIRLPSYVAGRLRRLRRAANRAYHERGACPALHDLATDAGLRTNDAERLLVLERGTVSIQAPLGQSGATIEDFLADPGTQLPLEEAEQRELARYVTEALCKLEPRAAMVLRLRYGLVDGQTRSLAQIGRTLGVSRERVRQIEESALERLRGSEDARRLRGLLEEPAPAAWCQLGLVDAHPLARQTS